jgi:hypothetical protein
MIAIWRAGLRRWLAPSLGVALTVHGAWQVRPHRKPPRRPPGSLSTAPRAAGPSTGSGRPAATEVPHAWHRLNLQPSGWRARQQTDQFDNLSATAIGPATSTGPIIADDNTAECWTTTRILLRTASRCRCGTATGPPRRTRPSRPTAPSGSTARDGRHRRRDQ